MLARASFSTARRIAVAVWFSLSGCTKAEATSAEITTTANAETNALPRPAVSMTAQPTKAAPTENSPSSNTTAPPCGVKPLPDCPLQAWMKANTNAQMASKDFAALASALDKTATFAPAGYTNWASVSKDGAEAARANDMSATKASCRSCHEQYKEKYKTELRARKL